MSRTTLRRYFRHGLFPQLMVFEAVARLGNVTRAGEELHLAQPTVSLQLKKLSAALEVDLFEQRGRQLYLTPAGEALKEECVSLVSVFQSMESRLIPFRKAKPEVLRLAAEPEARRDASRLLAIFCSKHPGVQASLHVAGRDALLARLSAGEDDVYLFGLEVEGLPAGRRWSLAHPRGRELAPPAALFVREALLLDAYNPALGVEEDAWSFRGTTTRQ